MCPSRGYPIVDLSNCAGVPTPVLTQECCDTSSTGGYFGTEVGSCEAYGFTVVDSSNCP